MTEPIRDARRFFTHDEAGDAYTDFKDKPDHLHSYIKHTHNGTTHTHVLGCRIHYGKPSWKCPECQAAEVEREADHRDSPSPDFEFPADWTPEMRAAGAALLGFINPTTDPAVVKRRRIAWEGFEQGRKFEHRWCLQPIDAERLAEAIGNLTRQDETLTLYERYRRWSSMPYHERAEAEIAEYERLRAKS